MRRRQDARRVPALHWRRAHVARGAAVISAAVALVATVAVLTSPGAASRKASAASRAMAARAAGKTAVRLVASQQGAAGAGPSASLPPGLRQLLAGVPAPLVAKLAAELASAPRRRVAAASGTSGASGCITVKETPAPLAAIVEGFNNITKMREASLLGPGQTNIGLPTALEQCPAFSIEFGTAQLSYRGRAQFPPISATFLTFGLAPVTATFEVSQVGVGKVELIIPNSSVANFVIFRTRLAVNVLSAKVNGSPLAVGPRCGTIKPVDAVVAGFSPTGLPGPGYYTVDGGGPLTGTVVFPPFGGCGVGENLSPLITASISGPANFVKLTQGRTCSLMQPIGPNSQCPPPVPVPLR